MSELDARTATDTTPSEPAAWRALAAEMESDAVTESDPYARAQLGRAATALRAAADDRERLARERDEARTDVAFHRNRADALARELGDLTTTLEGVGATATRAMEARDAARAEADALRAALRDVRGMLVYQSSDYARDACERIDAALAAPADAEGRDA